MKQQIMEQTERIKEKQEMMLEMIKQQVAIHKLVRRNYENEQSQI